VLVLPGCFALSGFAGILYQIAWARQLARVFGTTARSFGRRCRGWFDC
jgi:hypothetical protein